MASDIPSPLSALLLLLLELTFEPRRLSCGLSVDIGEMRSAGGVVGVYECLLKADFVEFLKFINEAVIGLSCENLRCPVDGMSLQVTGFLPVGTRGSVMRLV